MLQTGDILIERYEMGPLLGTGGMSRVFAAFDRKLCREVAIKVLDTALAEDGVFVERFDREARAAASLNHRHVVAVYDSGAQNGTRFIVMEHVSGRTLSALLRDGPLPVQQAVEIAASVAQALGAAHVRGIVHRDVKPGNVMVGADGEVKVLDFGIARSLAATSLTRTSTVIGTAGYLSPEQAQGGRVDPRSDLYGLGCVLHQMLTGRPPFVADSAAALAHQHLTRPPEPPSARRPEVPPALDAIVLRCLAKDPDDRYDRAEALSAALTKAPLARNGDPAAGERPTRVQSRTRVQRPRRRIVGTRLTAWPGAGRRRWLAVAAAALLATLVLVLALGHGSGGTPSASTARSAPAPRHAAATPAKGAAATDPASAARASSSPPASSSGGSATGPTDPSAAAAALRRLVLADQQQGLIDAKAARAILRRGEAVLEALSSGDRSQAAQQLSELTGKVDQLAAAGAVTTPAADALKAAAAALASSVTSASTPNSASGATAEPPAPVQGKHGKGHGHDGGGGEGSGD